MEKLKQLKSLISEFRSKQSTIPVGFTIRKDLEGTFVRQFNAKNNNLPSPSSSSDNLADILNSPVFNNFGIPVHFVPWQEEACIAFEDKKSLETYLKLKISMKEFQKVYSIKSEYKLIYF